MTNKPPIAKRWRPRFSVRTLVSVVTLMCCYAACWGPTKMHGSADVHEYILQQTSEDPVLIWTTAPFIVGVGETQLDFPRPITIRRCYYFWFFGYVAKLPYERDWWTSVKQSP
jgi:hypothetical protein